MFFFAVLLFGVLALGPQVVLSLSFKFKLSEVKQCEPVSIIFDGNVNANALPMWLSLIPFNSSPVSIPIPNAAAGTSGVDVTFVPFATGTTFIASLSGASGESVAKVSDIIRVLPSPSGNSTCLPETEESEKAPTRFNIIPGTFSQCETFTLNYDRSIVSRAPTVRYYNPKGPSRLLNLTADEPETGSATYMLSYNRGKEVVLVFDDGSTHAESSALMSKRRRKRQLRIQFSSSLLETGNPSISPRSPFPDSPTVQNDATDAPPGFVKDPPYTSDKFLSPTAAYYPTRESMASWAQPTPEDQRFPRRLRMANDAYSPRDPDDRHTLHSLDIEGILNLAAIQSDRSSGQTTVPAPVGTPSPGPSSAQLDNPDPSFPARGHLRDASEIPFAPGTSMASALTLSSVVDPFTDNATKQPGSAHSPYSPIRAPHSAVVGLPTSPRHGPRFSRDRNSDISGIDQQKASYRSTKGSMGDYYGFARS
ncbi:hypothetical protein DXG03_003294 [Asterophora parasitica]|uniref:Uncharacterized protein n=1 Tax=Asterophora parasitica TaxID=117018 RepID=A0A9P7GGE5_9AGAR|nr:hypothetical protein DXG03_003294 [Asterophora parasitica]